MAIDTGNNQSVERASAVLSALSHGRSMRVSEVSRHIGLGQSTTSRLLATLESLELVERDQESGLYKLGLALLPLAGAALNENPIHRSARQPAQDLAGMLGLGANVAIRRGDELFYLCNFEGKDAPKFFTLMGQRNPLHATALGKCLLLDISPGDRRALLPSLKRFTPNTAKTHEELDLMIDEVSERGYSIEREELAFGRTCLAVPIKDAHGSVMAAISISGRLSAMDLPNRELEISRIAIETADSISTALGYTVPWNSAIPIS